MSGTEINELIPSDRQVETDGESIRVRAFRVRQLPLLTGPIQRLSKHVSSIGELDIEAILTHSLVDLASVIAIAVDRDSEWVLDLPLLDVLRLAGAVMEVNEDFLSHVARFMDEMTRAVLSLAGAISSKPS